MREIIDFAKRVIEEEGAAWDLWEPTRNGHYRILFNVGDAREQHILAHQKRNGRFLQNIRADLRRKVRQAREKMNAT